MKMGASWSAQDFRQTGVTQSVPCAFFLFCFRKTWRTSSSLIWIAAVGERGVAGGVQGGCGMFCQTSNITHSNLRPVVDSSQCWGMMSCSWLSLSDLSTLILSHWKRIGSVAYWNNSSLPLWSPFPVCICPVYTRLYPPSYKHLLWPNGAVWVLQWTS